MYKDLDQCWYPDLALEAVRLGIVAGTPDGLLLPREKIDREQTWLMIMRALKMSDFDKQIPDLVQQFMPSVVRIWTKTGIGSGAYIAPNYILTNAHVVKEQLEVTVDTSTVKNVKAKVIKCGSTAPGGIDLAIVKIDRPGNSLKFAEKIIVGEPCLVMGNPLGEWQSVSAGIVTRFGGEYLQTDALVNPGNSGGVCINARGEILGIPTMKIIGEGIDNHNYCILASIAKEFIKGVF